MILAHSLTCFIKLFNELTVELLFFTICFADIDTFIGDVPPPPVDDDEEMMPEATTG